jgi:lysophospholipase L1-like esterase
MTRASTFLALAAACALPTASLAQAPAPASPQVAFPGQYAAAPAEWKYPVWPNGCLNYAGEERTSCLEFVASDYGRLSRYAAANAALATPREDETRVVFFGDSITDNWSKAAGGGFFPGKPYVNRGIGGQTTSQMLVRFRADVLELQPKAVVILAGTNDVAGNSGRVSVDAIEDNLATMAELAQAHGVQVVLASLLPISDDEQDSKGGPLIRSTDRPPSTLREINAWLSAYAARNGHVYLDYHSAMANASGLLRSALTDDGLHPNAAGYALMAPLAEQAIAEALAPARR